MSFNQGSLSYTGKNGGAGSAVARNGVSVDANGFVVLGNDVGDVLAALLNDRQIPMETFFLELLQTLATLPTLTLSAGNITSQTMLAIEGATTTKFRVFQTDGGESVDPYNNNFWHFIGNSPIE